MLLYIETFSYNNMADGCVNKQLNLLQRCLANPLLVNYLDQIHTKPVF